MTVDDLMRFCELLLESHATRGATPRGLAVAMTLGTYRQLSPGDALFEIGDPAGGLYVLMRGEVALEQVDGPSLVRKAPCLLGQRDLNDTGVRTRAAIAEPGAEVSLVELDSSLVRMLSQRPDEIGSTFRRLIISSLVQRVRTSVKQTEGVRPKRRRRRPARSEDDALKALAGVVEGWDVDLAELDSVEAVPDVRPRRPGRNQK